MCPPPAFPDVDDDRRRRVDADDHSSAATITAGTKFHQQTDTLDYTGASTPAGSSYTSDSITVVADGTTAASTTATTLTNFHADGSADGTIVTASTSSDHTAYTLEGTLQENPGFLTELDGFGHDNVDRTFDETLSFIQPADGEVQETAVRQITEDSSRQDAMIVEIGGSEASGWTSMSFYRLIQSNDTHDRSYSRGETVAADGTVTATDHEELTTLSANSGDFTITEGGSWSDGGLSISYGTTIDVDFHDVHRETDMQDTEAVVELTTLSLRRNPRSCVRTNRPELPPVAPLLFSFLKRPDGRSPADS